MGLAHVVVRDVRVTLMWQVARWSAVLATAGLLVWMAIQPTAALTALWYVAIPILPATFFVNTTLWRGVCPLATLNEWGNRLGSQRLPSLRVSQVLGAAGLVLFYLLVPARRFLFNQNGLWLIVTVVGVAAIALGLGALFSVRSAFCNGLCPVLPVELLYGQAPLVRLQRGRCASCVACTPKGCLDLAYGRAFSQVLNRSRPSGHWLSTPFGIFVAALPGFIVGYGELSDGPLGTAARVYATVLVAAVASYGLVIAMVFAFRPSARLAQTAIAAVAGALYYWYAGPAIQQHLDAGRWLGNGIRLLGIGLVGCWLAAALAPRGSMRAGQARVV